MFFFLLSSFPHCLVLTQHELHSSNLFFFAWFYLAHTCLLQILGFFGFVVLFGWGFFGWDVSFQIWAPNKFGFGYKQKLRKQNNWPSNGQISVGEESECQWNYYFILQDNIVSKPSSYFKFVSIIKCHESPLCFNFSWQCFEMVFSWNIWTLIALIPLLTMHRITAAQHRHMRIFLFSEAQQCKTCKWVSKTPETYFILNSW